MEKSGIERRQSQRFNVNLGCRLSLPAEEQSILFPNDRLAGRTRDVSATGIGLIVASIYLGFDCVVDEGRTLRLTLDLPAGVVELSVTPVHYLRLDRGAPEEPSYLIGLRITETTEDNRARYTEYLAELAAAERG